MVSEVYVVCFPSLLSNSILNLGIWFDFSIVTSVSVYIIIVLSKVIEDILFFKENSAMVIFITLFSPS